MRFPLYLELVLDADSTSDEEPAADEPASERKTSLGCRLPSGNGRAGEGRGGKRLDENFVQTEILEEILPIYYYY
jgi:hypothetical protein